MTEPAPAPNLLVEPREGFAWVPRSARQTRQGLAS